MIPIAKSTKEGLLKTNMSFIYTYLRCKKAETLNERRDVWTEKIIWNFGPCALEIGCQRSCIQVHSGSRTKHILKQRLKTTTIDNGQVWIPGLPFHGVLTFSIKNTKVWTQAVIDFGFWRLSSWSKIYRSADSCGQTFKRNLISITNLWLKSSSLYQIHKICFPSLKVFQNNECIP